LLQVIGDILEFTKFEKCIGVNLQNGEFNLQSLLEDALEIISYNGNQQHIELILKTPKDLPGKNMVNSINFN
jgi:hypothetical protein